MTSKKRVGDHVIALTKPADREEIRGTEAQGTVYADGETVKRV